MVGEAVFVLDLWFAGLLDRDFKEHNVNKKAYELGCRGTYGRDNIQMTGACVGR